MVETARAAGQLARTYERLRVALRGPVPHDTTVSVADLTDRERDVLRFLPSQLSQREIGLELYLSRNTVKSHTRSLYRKLGVSSREAAIARARELGLALTLTVENGLAPIHMDPLGIHQCLLNLVTNAIDAASGALSADDEFETDSDPFDPELFEDALDDTAEFDDATIAEILGEGEEPFGVTAFTEADTARVVTEGVVE